MRFLNIVRQIRLRLRNEDPVLARKPTHNKGRPTIALTPAMLRVRIQAALRESRIPQALELVKNLLAQEPTEPNRQLLREVYLEGARQQIAREAWNDARQLLDQAERVDGPSNWWEALALLRAKSGDATIARQLLAKVPGTTLGASVNGHLVDRALKDPRNGKLKLSADLHEGFDAVIKAFLHYERGETEAGKQALQSIGLQSPYLDWKLLVRGLMSHAVEDDARALENWQRLDPERLPAKLAEPFRYQLDANYRNSLPAKRAGIIAKRADTNSHPILGQLRDIQRLLGSAEQLPDALRQVPSLVGLMKLSMPQHLPKLANCFYWLIVLGGDPQDLDRYKSIFGPHPDDKHFNRLQAMIIDSGPHLDVANKFWKDYRDEIAQAPDRWPGESGKRAQAMISMKMGENAIEYLDAEAEDPFDDFMFMFSPHSSRKKKVKTPLVPSIETCFRRAMELAPDWKDPAVGLMNWYEEKENWVEAETIGLKILERFPDDNTLLMAVSNAQFNMGKKSEALEKMRRALKNNPLDRTLRTGVAVYSVQIGRALALEGDREAAVAAFREAIDLDAEICGNAARAGWAACEYKAGFKAKAEELVAELAAEPDARIAAAFYLLVECTRIKANKAFLKEVQKRFDDALADKPTMEEINSFALALGLYRQEVPPYRGIGTHEKKLAAIFQTLLEEEPTEEELVQMGLALWMNKLHKVLKACAAQGSERFPENPCFPFLEAEQAILQRPKSFSKRNVGNLFGEVLSELEDQTDEQSRLIRERIEERLKEFPELEEWIDGDEDDDDGIW